MCLDDAGDGVTIALDGVALARDAVRRLYDGDMAGAGPDTAGDTADALAKLLHLRDDLRDVVRIIDNRQLRRQLDASSEQP